MMICFGAMAALGNISGAVLGIMILGEGMLEAADKVLLLIITETIPDITAGHAMVGRLQVSGTILAAGQTTVKRRFSLVWITIRGIVGKESLTNNTKFGLG